MCGRTSCTLSPDALCKACCYKKSPSDHQYSPAEWVVSSDGKEYRPSTNFSPTFYGPVMIAKRLIDPSATPKERVIQPMMWGMIPPWHTGTPTKHGLTTNNCRIEGITSKRLFKDPLMKGHRCVVLCDGFYEWKALQGKGAKQPYFIYAHQPEGVSVAEPETWENLPIEAFWSQQDGWKGPRPLMVAGLFDVWKSPEDGKEIKSYSVVTMDASPAFDWIHERMPALLDTEEQVDAWLDSARIPAQDAIAGLKPSVKFVTHPVSSAVGSVKNQERSLTRPVDLSKPKPLSGSGKFMANWLGKKEGAASSSIKAECDPPGAVKRQLVPQSDTFVPPSKIKKEDPSLC